MNNISSPPQANAQEIVNENFDTLAWAAVYGKRHAVTTGLTWGYYGGRWGGFPVSDGTLTLTNSTTNYVVVNRTNGAISVSTSATNWNNINLYARVYAITTANSVVTVVEDHRAGPMGIFGHIPVGSPAV
jgi:hypothetical protein